MKITFFSCYLTIHQLPISEMFFELLGEDYRYVATEPISKWRLEMGYEDIDKKYSYVLTTYDSEENKKLAYKLAIESDVVIIGSAPDKYIISRLQEGKLTFKYSERPYKNGVHLNNFIRILGGTWLHHGRFQKKSLYMLCASAYTASDFAKFGCYKNKCFKWGYFPKFEVQNLNNIAEIKQKKNICSILWVGRLISWKHPELVIKVADYLKRKGYLFEINIIGGGELKDILKQMIDKLELQNYVHIIGAIPSKDVRKFMEKANIFLFTSDSREGWGAVLNEAMNSGCAVVANPEIGSVPFLIKDSKNGFIYRNENELYEKVIYLMDNPDICKQVGEEAYRTLELEWNERVAAIRFIELAENLINGKRNMYKEGPCSPI